MKKTISIILIALLIMSIAACSSPVSQKPTGAVPSETAVQPTEPASEAPAEETA